MATPEDGLRAAEEATKAVLKECERQNYLLQKSLDENHGTFDDLAKDLLKVRRNKKSPDAALKAIQFTYALKDVNPAQKVEHSGKTDINVVVTNFGNNGSGKET